MTREEIKEAAKVMEAYADGKKVQKQDINGLWIDCDNPMFDWASFNYRIKPGPKYGPFETQEECWNEMLKHQPFGWVKSPRGELFCIDKVFEEGIVYKHSSCHFNEYLEGQYSFVDGTPFGIKEEQYGSKAQ